ncbi:transposase, IS30 family [Xanthomonas fragariae]|nr:transposase, IS30 family [Xanthomonas fragariae]
MSSSRLDLSERYRLHALYETGMSMRAIASALERAPSTRSAANCNATSTLGSHGKAVVVSMTEPRSRLHLLAYSPDGTA